MKAVVYCRISTDERDQLNSFNNQKNHYQELFSKNNEIKPASCGMLFSKKEAIYNNEGIFADEGITGTKLKKREAFKYMLECAKRKEFDTIYVKNIARFSRSSVDGGNALKTLKGYGVRVIFEDLNLESTNPAHELTISMLMSVAQEESRAKSDSIKFGIRKLQQKGGWSSSAVYGYDRKNGYLVINEKEAETVKKIFSYFLAGWGVNKIVRYLNENNIPTKKDKKWNLAQIRDMLRNKLVTGVQTTHKSTNTDVNRTSSKEQGTNYIEDIDPSEWIVTYRPEAKIIDEEDFKQVQKEIDIRLNYKANHTYKGTHLLSNLIICGHCKGSYRRKTRGKYGHYWTCRAHDSYGNSVCDKKYGFSDVDLTSYIKDKILDLKQADLNNVLEAYLGTYFSFDPKRIYELKKELEKINYKIEIIFEEYSEKQIPKEEYRERNNILRNKKAEAEEEIKKITNFEQEVILVNQKYQQFIQTIEEFDIENITNNELRKLFGSIVIRPLGKSAERVKEELLVFDYIYNFMDVSTSKLLEDVKKMGTSNNQLLDNIQFANTQLITYNQGKYGICEPDESDEKLVIGQMADYQYGSIKKN